MNPPVELPSPTAQSDDALSPSRAEQPGRSHRPRAGIVWARLLIGVVILICAEVFSGASLQMGLWNPWTLIVTYWLYFAHFFFLTTLAVWTGRTSLGALYLWGVLFGLYESWITKVIWYGYSGDGKLVLGNIGPYGYSEISMVFLFHPVMSFLIPLAVACLLCPPLRRLFPDLAWFTAATRGARLTRGYIVVSLIPVMAMNSGGPVNLAVNVALVLGVMIAFSRLARPALSAPDGRAIVAFGRWGFVGLVVYLVWLYVTAYFVIRPEGLPSLPIQLFTFVFYALVIAGLRLHRRREPLPGAAEVEQRELRLVKVLFAVMLAVAMALSVLSKSPSLFVPIVGNFVFWTLLGFVLTAIALVDGVRTRRATARTDHGGRPS